MEDDPFFQDTEFGVAEEDLEEEAENDLWEFTHGKPSSLQDIRGWKVGPLVSWLSSFVVEGIKRSKPAFLLIAPSGTGKTVLAELACKRANFTTWKGKGSDDDELIQDMIDAAATCAATTKSLAFLIEPYEALQSKARRQLNSFLSGSSSSGKTSSGKASPPIIICADEDSKELATLKTHCEVLKLGGLANEDVYDIVQRTATAARDGVPIKKEHAASVVAAAKGNARSAITLLQFALSSAAAKARLVADGRCVAGSTSIFSSRDTVDSMYSVANNLFRSGWYGKGVDRLKQRKEQAFAALDAGDAPFLLDLMAQGLVTESLALAETHNATGKGLAAICAGLEAASSADVVCSSYLSEALDLAGWGVSMAARRTADFSLDTEERFLPRGFVGGGGGCGLAGSSNPFLASLPSKQGKVSRDLLMVSALSTPGVDLEAKATIASHIRAGVKLGASLSQATQEVFALEGNKKKSASASTNTITSASTNTITSASTNTITSASKRRMVGDEPLLDLVTSHALPDGMSHCSLFYRGTEAWDVLQVRKALVAQALAAAALKPTQHQQRKRVYEAAGIHVDDEDLYPYIHPEKSRWGGGAEGV